MSAERDVNRIVRSWLFEDEHDSADRVLQSVIVLLDTTPQRRSWWPARRTRQMNSAYKLALGAGAVLVAVFVGLQLLPLDTGPGNPTPAPTTQPTVAPPSASPVPPTATVTPMPPEGRALAPGQYSVLVPDSDVRAILTVGEGWTSGSYFIMNPPGFTKQISFWTIGNVYEDICDPATGGLATASQLPSPPIGPTVDDLVAALDAQVNTDTSSPVDVTVGGYAGKRVTIVISEPYEHCIGDADSRPMWVDADGDPQRRLQPGDPDTILILDVEGRRVVIVTNDDESPDAGASIAAVIAAIEFEVP